jgi:hypothetical protein
VVRAAASATLESVFKRPMIVAGPQALEQAAQRYAGGLSGAFGGSAPLDTARCEADLALDRAASLVVVAKPTQAGGWFGDSAERMLRSCTLPMLFVPGNA